MLPQGQALSCERDASGGGVVATARAPFRSSGWVDGIGCAWLRIAMRGARARLEASRRHHYRIAHTFEMKAHLI